MNAITVWVRKAAQKAAESTFFAVMPAAQAAIERDPVGSCVRAPTVRQTLTPEQRAALEHFSVHQRGEEIVGRNFKNG